MCTFIAYTKGYKGYKNILIAYISGVVAGIIYLLYIIFKPTFKESKENLTKKESPLQKLKESLAEGKITTSEYKKRKKLLEE
jgi:uncharacterized membrane protein